jgi:ribosomal protein L11 methyltransferase
MAVWVFSIQLHEDMDAEEISGYFSGIDMEGLEVKESELCIYLDDAQLAPGEIYIHETCEQLQLTYTRSELEQKNWNETWEKSFQPVLVDDLVYIRAGFHPVHPSAKYDIIIDPKMSFGTGHHPTTFQVMQCMHLLPFQDARVLDCGSGTGILSILAVLLGAADVIALDHDDWCYKNVQENIQLNHTGNIRPVLGELSSLPDTGFDLILANIHRNYLLEHMSLLSEKLVKKGKIIMSGFYGSDAFVILQKALDYNLIACYYSEQHNWACVVLEKRRNGKNNLFGIPPGVWYLCDIRPIPQGISDRRCRLEKSLFRFFKDLYPPGLQRPLRKVR